jgi:FKBP-type peptidyl-prolyl cis-trans isomerase FkpA/FKBP-type peptidyl-prolyl cis-trans isomerase FklB
MSTGAIFDSHPVTAVTFPSLSGLIQGWQIGFQLLGQGSIATLYIPSGLGYGPSGSGPIPANANLIFDVSLVGVK